MYHFLVLIARILIFLVSRSRVIGREHVPLRGPFILVSNHRSVGDPVLLGVKLERRVVFMAKEELFRNRLSAYFIRSFGAFPVYRGRLNRNALRQASQVLEQGGVLGMFPEGKRSSNETLQSALFGTAFIAHHNNVSILPVSLVGSEAMKGFGWIWQRPEVIITIGRPFNLPNMPGPLTRDMLADNTAFIMQRIAELLPEKYRGEFADGKRNEGKNRKG